jgi:vacuolar iron transporter family protein
MSAENEDPGNEHPQLNGFREHAQHYLKDLIYGANDGIITTFAIVAGVAGADLSVRTILILGFANLLADGFSMGASNFLSIRSDEAVREEQGLPAREPHAFRHGLVTYLAFVVVGVVPLLAYLFPLTPKTFLTAGTSTLLVLFMVGAARSLITVKRWWTSGLEMLSVGAVAAGVAYGIGAFVAGLT